MPRHHTDDELLVIDTSNNRVRRFF